MDINHMDFGDFGWALSQLRLCHAVSRWHWNGPGQYIRLQPPDPGSEMTLPYLYISTVTGDLVPWLASQTDLLALDWYVLLRNFPDAPLRVKLTGSGQAE